MVTGQSRFLPRCSADCAPLSSAPLGANKGCGQTPGRGQAHHCTRSAWCCSSRMTWSRVRRRSSPRVRTCAAAQGLAHTVAGEHLLTAGSCSKAEGSSKLFQCIFACQGHSNDWTASHGLSRSPHCCQVHLTGTAAAEQAPVGLCGSRHSSRVCRRRWRGCTV